jgi:hypothetical protein
MAISLEDAGNYWGMEAFKLLLGKWVFQSVINLKHNGIQVLKKFERNINDNVRKAPPNKITLKIMILKSSQEFQAKFFSEAPVQNLVHSLKI